MPEQEGWGGRAWQHTRSWCLPQQWGSGASLANNDEEISTQMLRTSTTICDVDPLSPVNK